MARAFFLPGTLQRAPRVVPVKQPLKLPVERTIEKRQEREPIVARLAEPEVATEQPRYEEEIVISRSSRS